MVFLGVNIDHVATIRQARGTTYPDILEAAKLAIKGGADQITVHLREDRRHIQDQDLIILKDNLTVPLNLEMAATKEITEIALKLLPATATIVPEKRQEITTESGIDVIKNFELIKKSADQLIKADIKVSLFIEPEPEQIKASAKIGAYAVEFHTGPYCLTRTKEEFEDELEKLKIASMLAKKMKIKVVAGHGLHYRNIKILLKTIPEIEELNIGHAIIARSVFVGLDKAVREMRDLL